jgi:sugar/nucleoside kinase (ribokinase family)
MGLSVAVVTRLANEDWHVVDELTGLGVMVLAKATPHSTCLRLEYPTSNVDERVITLTSSAGTFEPAEVAGIKARAVIIGTSVRDEVGLDVVQALGEKETLLAADVQGFLRVVHRGKMTDGPWAEKEGVLAHLDVLKTDAAEAKALTGRADKREAARVLADMGPGEILISDRDGLLALAAGRFYYEGFCPLRLVGRSGRGDTSLAAYVAKRLTASPAEATVWAAAVASLKMEAEGPFRRSMSEVQSLIQRCYRR